MEDISSAEHQLPEVKISEPLDTHAENQSPYTDSEEDAIKERDSVKPFAATRCHDTAPPNPDTSDPWTKTSTGGPSLIITPCQQGETNSDVGHDGAPGPRSGTGAVNRRSPREPDGASGTSSPSTVLYVGPPTETDPLVVSLEPKHSTRKCKEVALPQKQQINRDGKAKKFDHTEVPNIPDTNIAVACLVTLCFNLPLGAVAIYFSLMAAKAYRDGQAKKGAKRTRISIYISLFSIVLTVLIVMSVVLLMAMRGQSRQAKRKTMKTSISL